MGTLPRTLVKWEIVSGYLWGHYTVAFEFHDDVLELDSLTRPTSITFYQVKTKATGTWTLANISASPGAKALKKNSKPGDLPPEKKLSFAAKMFDNFKRFPDHTDRLVFVTNQVCTDLVAGHMDTQFETAAKAKLDSFRARLKEQDPEFKDQHSKLFHFCCSSMSLASFDDTIMGAVQKFVIEQTGMTDTSTYAFALMLLEECRKRERLDVDFSSFNTMSGSFVTRELIAARLGEFRKKRQETVEWASIAPFITNLVWRRNVGAAWHLYVNDRKTRYGPGPQRFQQAVKEAVEPFLQGKVELNDEVDAALPSVRKLAALWDTTVSDNYLRAVIIYEFHNV